MVEHPYITIICTNCGHQISVPLYCHNRFCPVCSRPRLKRVRKRLQWYCSNVQLLPGQRLKHLVLTVKSSDDLEKSLNHLISSFRKFRGSVWWKKHVSGGAYTIEITKGPFGWHPHLHCIVQSWFMPYHVLKAKWEKLSGAWSVSICERPAHTVANYITDYITKLPASVDNPEYVNKCLQSRRLYSVFGKWHSMKCPLFKLTHPCPKCGESAWIPETCLSHEGFRSPPKMQYDYLPRKSARA